MNCEHMEITRIEMPPTSPHRIKIICARCDKFLGWEASPESIAKKKMYSDWIATLLKIEKTEWETSFVESISKQKSWSPKQLKSLYDLREKYL